MKFQVVILSLACLACLMPLTSGSLLLKKALLKGALALGAKVVATKLAAAAVPPLVPVLPGSPGCVELPAPPPRYTVHPMYEHVRAPLRVPVEHPRHFLPRFMPRSPIAVPQVAIPARAPVYLPPRAMPLPPPQPSVAVIGPTMNVYQEPCHDAIYPLPPIPGRIIV